MTWKGYSLDSQNVPFTLLSKLKRRVREDVADVNFSRKITDNFPFVDTHGPSDHVLPLSTLNSPVSRSPDPFLNIE